MNTTAPGMALFLLAVLIATPILTAALGVLIEHRTISAGSRPSRREKAGTGRADPPRLPVSANHRNERGTA